MQFCKNVAQQQTGKIAYFFPAGSSSSRTISYLSDTEHFAGIGGFACLQPLAPSGIVAQIFKSFGQIWCSGLGIFYHDIHQKTFAEFEWKIKFALERKPVSSANWKSGLNSAKVCGNRKFMLGKNACICASLIDVVGRPALTHVRTHCLVYSNRNIFLTKNV